MDRSPDFSDLAVRREMTQDRSSLRPQTAVMIGRRQNVGLYGLFEFNGSIHQSCNCSSSEEEDHEDHEACPDQIVPTSTSGLDGPSDGGGAHWISPMGDRSWGGA